MNQIVRVKKTNALQYLYNPQLNVFKSKLFIYGSCIFDYIFQSAVLFRGDKNSLKK